MLTGKAMLVRLVKAGFLLGLCSLMPAGAQAATLCAGDTFGQTFLLNVARDFDAGLVASVHGWLDNGFGLILPINGTALVNAAGTRVRITIESVNHLGHQRVGIGMDTDFNLNGTGNYENVNAGPVYDTIAETWIATTCPGPPSFSPSVEGGIATTPPRIIGKGK